MSILVAMPAYNEAKYIGSLVIQSRNHADAVLVVDDGSTDATTEIAWAAGAEVIRHEAQSGKGAAVQTIFREARERGVDILVLMDADFQHLPDEIPQVIKPIEEGYDISIGSRVHQAEKTPKLRRAGQKILRFSSSFVSTAGIQDSESGFRAFSKKAIEQLKLEEAGFAIETEMLAEAEDKGLTIVETPISNIYTGDGSTLPPFKHGISVFRRIIDMISERRPLLFFGLFGAFFLLLGLALGIKVISDYFFDTSVLATGSAMLTVLFITIGLLTLSTGIILDVLVKRLNKKL